MAEAATSIEAYLDGVPPDARAALERIRGIVTHLVPGLEETVSYRMPTLKYRGQALVYFTASKRHLSFYPSSRAIEALRDRLGPWETTEHAIRFTLDTPLPDDLIEDLVRVHVAVIDRDRQ
jgi:uncharacterized protein YdhG (YjbR/CyaY superfamily)